MKASELRIGNWIASGQSIEHQKTWVVGKVHSISSMESDFEQLEVETAEEFTWFFKDGYWGIPLTEEILLDCGWGKGDYDFEFIDNFSLDDEVLSYDVKVKVLIIQCNRDTIYLYHIKHLHQLQNLYFALTNKELEYKPK